MNEMTPILYRWRLGKCTSVKRFTFWNASAKVYNFRVPVYKGVPLTLMKWYPSLNDDTYPSILLSKSFTFRKVSAKVCSFRVPVYKGVPLTWMKWNPFFIDEGLSSVQEWKVSLSKKWVQIYTTSRFPFIRGSPPMNEMTPILYRWRLAKCTGVKRFTFRKVSAKIFNFRVPIYKGVPFPWMKWYPSLEDDC